MPSQMQLLQWSHAKTIGVIIFIRRGLPIVRNIKNNFRDIVTFFDSAQ